MTGEEVPGYCALYAACSKQLKHEQRSCMPTSAAGRLMPGLPRRRTGICNQLLVADFQALDILKLRVEQMFDDCVDEAVKEEKAIPNDSAG
uniref:Uncharacterized protein n=1 Tax=Parascaris univalens TaxID=6257 RepID=A0A915CBG9_PARUN